MKNLQKKEVEQVSGGCDLSPCLPDYLQSNVDQQELERLWEYLKKLLS